MTADTDKPRRSPNLSLKQAGIPSVVWFEDAIAHYGVLTAVFDLYILVPDIDAAAQVLVNNGWKSIPQNVGEIGNAVLTLSRHPQRRLQPPPTAPENCTVPIVVLLPAEQYNFDFEKHASSTAFMPSLENLVDALLATMLDCTAEDDFGLQSHLNLQLSYLYGYVQQLQDRNFADRLRYEHRQYHLDVVSGMSYSTVPFINHQRIVRNALRQGTMTLQTCSARSDNKTLFG